MIYRVKHIHLHIDAKLLNILPDLYFSKPQSIKIENMNSIFKRQNENVFKSILLFIIYKFLYLNRVNENIQIFSATCFS